MSIPTLTVRELSDGIDDNADNECVKKVLEGLLNDYMDLQYAKSTPYTTGKQILPSGSTLEDVDKSITSVSDQKFKDIFSTISEAEKKGDFTPKSESDGSWDPKFTPVFVFVTSNP